MPDFPANTAGRRHYTRSSSFIVAMVFTILCGLVAIGLAYMVAWFARGHFVHSTAAVLDAEMRYLDVVGQPPADGAGRLYLLLNPDGSLPEDVPVAIERFSEGIVVFDYPVDARRYAARVHHLKDGRKLLVAFDITETSADFRFMQWIGVAGIIFIVMVVFVSYLISLFVVSGTNRIATTAQDIIDTGDLSRRVEVSSSWDDLSNMAQVLNSLLARIEDLMQGVRQVADNIAHDLRTPLTRMRNHIETLQTRRPDDVDLGELLQEVDHLLNTFNALLRISRIESERQRQQFVTLDLATLLDDVVGFYEPLAESKELSLSCSLQSGYCQGDRDLLFQAFANLLDNAIKYTPAGGRVSIKLTQRSEGRSRICIRDSGCGVPKSEQQRIFERFYRSEHNRSSPGSGLGLSLVAAVIDVHHGQISVADAEPGLKIVIDL